MDKPKLSISFLKKGGVNSSGALANASRETEVKHPGEYASPFDRNEAPSTVANDAGDPLRLPSSSRAGQTLRKENKEDREVAEDDKAWLQVGLVVRVQETTLSDGLYNGMTGIVKAVVGHGGYGADVQVANGDVLRLDQDDLRTMVPSPGEFGLIVRGNYCDTKVRVISLNKGELEVELEEGRRAGHRLLLPVSHVSRHIAIK